MPKRRAASSDSEDEEHLSTASKRARTIDTDDSEDEQPSTSRSNGKSKKKRVEVDEDMNVDEEDDSEDEEARKFEDKFSEQILADIQAKFNKGGVIGSVAEYGILEQIEMHNFMCHKYLKMPLALRSTSTGHNGSGKSAVLSAITVALGGKSTSTGRGSGLKSFIKEGSQWSEVTVHIKNTGDDAFKPEEYGKSIAVTRRFTKDGTSSYKLRSGEKRTKDKEGPVISIKRDELAAICDHMNLQVDNPMSVLTQGKHHTFLARKNLIHISVDAARQFLSASTPEDKYQFFLKGTQLEQLKQEYDIALNNVVTTNTTLERKMDAKKAREQRQKVEELKKEKAWSLVADKEREMTSKMEARAEAAELVPQIEAALAQEERILDKMSSEVTSLTAELEDLPNSDDLESQKVELGAQIRIKAHGIQRIQNDLKTAQNKKKEVEDQIAGYEEEIRAQKKLMERHTDEKRQARERTLNEAQEAVDKAQAAFNDNKSKHSALGTEEMQLKDELGQYRRTTEDLQRQIARFDSDLQQARNSKVDTMAAYGYNMKAVLESIDKQRWHGEKPLGPLGVYVTAKSSDWAEILRKQLAQLLWAFAITDARDRHQLHKILTGSKNTHCNIIIAKRDNFDYSHGEAPSAFHTILRELEFTDEHVLRIFINQRRIEKTILANTRAEAQAMMRRIIPGQEAQAWTLDNFSYRAFAGGGDNTNLLGDGPKNVSPMLLSPQRDTAQMIRDIEARKATVEREYHEAEQKSKSVNSRYNAIKREQEQLHREGRVLTTAMNKARSRFETVRGEMNEELPADIAVLEEAKREALAEVESFIGQFEDIIAQKVPLETERKELLNEVKAIQAKISSNDAAKSAKRQEIQTVAIERQQHQSNVTHYQKKVTEANIQLQQATELEEIVTQEYGNWRVKALEYTEGEVIENPRAIHVIERQIEAGQRALAAKEATQGASVEELAAAFQKADKLYSTVREEINAMRLLNHALQQSITNRMVTWHDFRLHIALRCKKLFSYHLSQRGYYGKVMFKHGKGTLDLKVKTDEQMGGKEGTREKDPRSLSGGEKSFSTICLLLSLWDAINSPLRCLDEFDVFMDAVNRRISMKMMIDTANAANQKQYILITPQDMSNCEPWTYRYAFSEWQILSVDKDSSTSATNQPPELKLFTLLLAFRVYL
ncbi:P-loop containing nucleoside triphosphate hydrolase protein [Flagelloscypha sp. PMI_526]|nr:P-loop containing nucleoside triphosphate hydrolase protein [Flagelloscypha sp. PMI_526]